MSPKVRIVESAPSEQLLAQAAAEHIVTDSTGRAITLKKPGVLAQFRIVEVAGDSAKNEVYMAMVMPLIFVVAIGETPIFQPINKLQLEGLIERLSEAGIEAVMAGVARHWGQQNPEADKAAVKK